LEHVVIIGNGISGVTAARHVRKLSDKRVTIVSAETDYFFSRTALMYVYMGHMKFEHTQPYENWFWKKNRIELKKGFVETIDYSSKTLSLSGGDQVTYDKLILAVGSKPNKFGWPGQNLKGVQGLYSKQDLDLMEENTSALKVERAVIVGGGLIGVEMAEMLHSRNIPVSFFVREDQFWGNVLPLKEAEIIGKHLESRGIDLRFTTELKEIISDESGRVKAVVSSNGEELACQFVGLTPGVSPNIDFLKKTDLETEEGIVVNQFLETNQPDVYSIGDCAQFSKPVAGRNNLEQVWYTGRIMGETVAQTICGNKLAYKPGHWFNSAKFFDIEYQTYGRVKSRLQEGEANFYWEHKNGEMCMNFVFDKASRKFLGLNTLGIRIRHEVMNHHLDADSTIDKVMEQLKDANFDPEFYRVYEDEIVAKFNVEQGTNISVKKRSWKRILGAR
jgi:NADPH-dependent 2,4-dienoyl-CoA reductase/sulfur reductase-like enzyme